jgi:hypothetical protein
MKVSKDAMSANAHGGTSDIIDFFAGFVMAKPVISDSKISTF